MIEEKPTEIKQRIRRSPDQIRSLVKEWKESGQSQREFCKRNNLAVSPFNRWAVGDKNSKKSEGFTVVKISVPPVDKNPLFEVILINGTRLNFFQPVEAKYLRSLLG
jgi:hypothetical protein